MTGRLKRVSPGWSRTQAEPRGRNPGPGRPRGAKGLGLTLLAFTIMALALLTVPAEASPSLTDGAEAPPVPAWSAFCERLPTECLRDRSEPETVAGTPELLELIETVNLYVNGRILPVRDIDSRGVIDRWEYPFDEMGDCEDIQLLKRRYLVEAGVPKRALPITVVLDEYGEGHAVLTVRTAGADLILDNKIPEIRRWDRTGYTFIKREGDAPTGWVFVEDRPAASVVTAAAQ